MYTRGRILFVLLIGSLAMGKVMFKEEFDEDWESRWIKSSWKADAQGEFVRTKGKWYGDEEMAYGLQTSTDMKPYVLSTKFPEPLERNKKPFVIQYSIKFEKPIECGGGYIKLVEKDFDPKTFGGETPLVVMFGPDICGGNNVIQLILDYNGTGRLWKKKPIAPADGLTHIYTLDLHPDDTYAVYLDAEPLENGTWSEDWDISVPKLIPDPNDKKPEVLING